MSTNIRLNEHFEIRPDTHCWVLVHHIPVNTNHHKSKGNTTRESHTYHASVRQCCIEALNNTGKEGIATAQELIDAWDQMVGQIEGAM